MKRVAIIVMPILASVTPLLPAQENNNVLTMEQAVERALEYNHTLKRTGLDVESAQALFDLSLRPFYPRINANTNLTILNERPESIFGIEQPQQLFSADITASIRFDASLYYNIQLARLQYEQGQITLDQVTQQTANGIRQMFLSLLLLREQIRIAEASLMLEQQRADRSAVRYDAGLIDEFTLLSARVAVSNRLEPLDALRSQFIAGLRHLNLAIGNEIDKAIEIEGEISPEIFPVDRERTVRSLVPLSPEIRQLYKAIDIFENQRNMHNSAFLPALIVSYQFAQNYQQDIFDDSADFFDADNWITGGGFGLALSIPLGEFIPGSLTWTLIGNAERDIAKAESMLIEREQSIIIEVTTLLDTLERTATNVQSKTLNIERAERALLLADEGYQVGLRELIEVRDAQNQLDNARFSELTERFNYINAQLDLLNILGIDLATLREYQILSE